MDCWICKKTALGVCRFCGRGICQEHARFLPFILDLYTPRAQGTVKALVVNDALHCGVCKPHPEPVDLPELQ